MTGEPLRRAMPLTTSPTTDGARVAAHRVRHMTAIGRGSSRPFHHSFQEKTSRRTIRSTPGVGLVSRESLWQEVRER